MRPLVLLLLAGCQLESGINGKPSEPAFSDGDTARPPVETDTDTAAPPDDTAETGTTPACDDATWPAETVPMDETCLGGAAVGSFTPVIEWTNTDPATRCSAPVVGQLTDDDGDGVITDADTPDVVVIDDSARIWAISGDGTTLWDVAGAGLGTAAIGDLDGDGFPEVVAPGWATTVAVHGENGARYWSGRGVGNATYGAPALADLEGDGDPEVIVGGTIFDGQTGVIRGTGAHGSGSGFSGSEAAAIGTAVDIDRDGILEVVVGDALYDPTGATIWTNGETDGFVAVADFDGDPEGEIVVSREGTVRLQDADGTVLWSVNLGSWGSGPPAVADLDGDGVPEIAVATMDRFHVLHGDGTTLWTMPIHDLSSAFTGASIFDFEGDGVPEVVYADEQDVWIFDGLTGAVKMQETTHSSVTASEYATVADVDGDGHAEILYGSNPWGGGTESGVRVIGDAADSWRPARKTWNQHSYDVTDIEDDGHIPTIPATNWDTYNTFRAADMDTVSTGPEPLPDLYATIRDVCTEECGEGRITVWLSVGNQGLADVTDPVTVTVQGVTEAGDVLLSTFSWTAALPAGTLSASESVEMTVPGPILALSVTVDGTDETSVVSECDEANNTASWAAGVCL